MFKICKLVFSLAVILMNVGCTTDGTFRTYGPGSYQTSGGQDNQFGGMPYPRTGTGWAYPGQYGQPLPDRRFGGQPFQLPPGCVVDNYGRVLCPHPYPPPQTQITVRRWHDGGNHHHKEKPKGGDPGLPPIYPKKTRQACDYRYSETLNKKNCFLKK